MDRPDIASAKVTLTIKTLVVVAGFCIGAVAAAVAGYFRLDAKADAGVVAKNTLAVMQCDIRQLKMFMIYGYKPSPLDRCDRAQYADGP